jgi:hypothetical protein
MGQGFAEQLMPDRGGWGAFGGVRAAPQPSEANIRLLVDMGFSRARVEAALRQTGDDVNAATAVLIHE